MIGLGEHWRKARKLAAILPSPVMRRGLWLGVAAAVENMRILRPLAFATIIDAGANKGQFSLLMRYLNPGAAIVAFEPMADAAQVFDRLFAADERTRLHRVALGRSGGMATLHVSRRPDSSSLLPISELQSRFAPGTGPAGLERVAVERLDHVLTDADIVAPALLKLDVQGGELAALEGCGDRLAAFDHIYAEVSFVPLYRGQALAHEVVAFLAAHDFALSGVNRPSHGPDGTCVQADLLFRRGGGMRS